MTDAIMLTDWVVYLELSYLCPDGVTRAEEEEVSVVVTAATPTSAQNLATIIVSQEEYRFKAHFDDDDKPSSEMHKEGYMWPSAIKVSSTTRPLDSDDYANGVLQHDHDWREFDLIDSRFTERGDGRLRPR
jgi:hypothetical protein